MLVDAKERFAYRVAGWLMSSGMDKRQVIERLALFPKEFVGQVNKAATNIRAAK